MKNKTKMRSRTKKNSEMRLDFVSRQNLNKVVMFNLESMEWNITWF
jgi:hypothetical protein